MVRHTLRSLWSHKRRLISTCVAVILGVAFMAGTLVLTSTVNRVFDDLFGNLGGKVDAVVRGKVLFEADFGGAQRAPLDDTLVDKVRAVDGVANAEGSIDSVLLTLLDHGGEPMGGGFGPPTIVGTWDPDPELNSYEVDQGRAPERAGEVIIDRAGARNGDFEIGDQVRIITPKGTVIDRLSSPTAKPKAARVTGDAFKTYGRSPSLPNIIASTPPDCSASMSCAALSMIFCMPPSGS